jgi:hypothetical protein
MDRGGRGQLRSCPRCSVSHVKEGRATGSLLASLSHTLSLLLHLTNPLLLSRFAGNHHYLSHHSLGLSFMPQPSR